MVLQAGAMGKGEGIFVLDMGEPVRILKLEEEINLLQRYAIDMDTVAIHTKLQEILREFQPIRSVKKGRFSFFVKGEAKR